MIAFLQLPYRSSAATAPAAGPASGLRVPPPPPGTQSLLHQRVLRGYLRLIHFQDPRELGPRVVGITLGLILAGQLALVLWLYFSQGRP